MEDGEHCCIASPPDTSVTSSTSCTDDQSGKTVHMSNNLHFSDEDTEVSSSCEMQSAHTACSSTAVDPLDPQVTTFTHYSDGRRQIANVNMKTGKVFVSRGPV